MKARLLLAVLPLVGCIEPSGISACGDLICPSDHICIDGDRCVAPEQLAACEGQVEGATCEAFNLPGRCTEHGGYLVCDAASCGDGVVDHTLHEDCDGDATIAAQCLDLGFDLGRPACSPACAYDTSTCTSFGWKLAANAAVTQLWTDGTTLAFIRANPPSLEVHGGGFDLSIKDTFAIVAGGGGVLYVSGGQSGLARVDSAGLVPIATPFDAGRLLDITVDERGVLFALVLDQLWTYDGAWVSPSGFPCSNCTQIALGPSTSTTAPRVFVLVSGPAVYELVADHYAFVVSFSSAGHELVYRGGFDDAVYVATDEGLLRFHQGDTDPTTLFSGMTTTVVATDRYVYAETDGGTIARWDGQRTERMHGPTIGKLAGDGHGGLYTYVGPIYRYTGTAFGDTPAPVVTPGESMRAITELPDGTPIVVTDRYLFIRTSPTSDTWSSVQPTIQTTIRGLAAYDSLHLAIAGYTDPPTLLNPRVMIGSIAGFSDVTPSPAPNIDALWYAPDQTLFAAGDQFLGSYAGGVWTTLAVPSCHFFAVHGIAASDVAAAGACDGVGAVWHYDGQTWAELYRATDLAGPFSGVRELATGQVVAAGEAGTVWFDGAWHTDTNAIGTSLSATTFDDVWLAGNFTAVQHWDGVHWSPMTTRALGPMVIDASADRVLMPGNAPGFVSLLR